MKKNIAILFLILTIAGLAFLIYSKKQQKENYPVEEKITEEVKIIKYPAIKDLDAHQLAYEKELEKIKIKRESLRKEYQATADKKPVLEEAKVYMRNALTEQLFPYWYGTVWDFEGHTDKPRDGLIACGYFVSTPMKHAGFNLNRYRLAQQAASNIIKSLVPSNNRKTYTDLAKMLAALEEAEDALYVVGLDNHVGFIDKKEGQIDFIHSSYTSPPGNYALRESAKESIILAHSSIYVIGKITNDNLAKKWLFGERITVIIS